MKSSINRRLRCLFLLALLATLAASPAGAARCNATCRADLARCMETECEGRGAAACRRRCKPAVVRTLAYVLSECRVDATGFVGHQALRIRRGDRDPVTVVEFSSSPGVSDPLELCRLYGESRTGSTSAAAGVLQRLGVSGDGSLVAFEVTDDFSFFAFTAVPSEAEGMFLVHADGSGLRRLGPPSRDPSFRIAPSVTGYGFDVAGPAELPFSPNRRRVVFTDVGPGPAGEDAVQVVTLDLATGRRTQLTRQPAGSSPFLAVPVTFGSQFVDDETVLFYSFTDPGGPNPEGQLLAFTVKVDGRGLERVRDPIALPGSRVVSTFNVTNLGTNLVDLEVPGTPANPIPGLALAISETFLVDGKRLLQLTNFHRVDTVSQFLSVDRRRAFFIASADPLGRNPSENCQLFSIDTLARRLRQVTDFNRGGPTSRSCFLLRRPGCILEGARQDPATRSVVFYSSCDPLGTNPYGGQVFAIRPGGAGLRQLTAARGYTTAGETVHVELPGPFAYSALRR